MDRNNFFYKTVGLLMISSLFLSFSVFAATGQPVLSHIEFNKYANNEHGKKTDQLIEATSSTAVLDVNGQPIFVGIVSSVNNLSLSIITIKNKIYSIDGSKAKVIIYSHHVASAVPFSSIKAGDTVVVQGEVNDISVSASTIVDQPGPGASNIKRFVSNDEISQKIFGRIVYFLSHFFGFFK